MPDSVVISSDNVRHTFVQILNLENFQIGMYSVIRATNYASSMYWLAWIILGKFIFLTLFLAVTLDAFERKYEVIYHITSSVIGLLHMPAHRHWLSTLWSDVLSEAPFLVAIFSGNEGGICSWNACLTMVVQESQVS